MLPERISEAREWVDKAMLDLQAAERLLIGDPPILEPALFHCQQAVEKALKAYLVLRNRPFSKTHDLVALLASCIELDPEFAAIKDVAAELTPYAVGFRYPGELPSPTRDEAEEGMRLAQQALNFVLRRLPSQAKP